MIGSVYGFSESSVLSDGFGVVDDDPVFVFVLVLVVVIVRPSMVVLSGAAADNDAATEIGGLGGVAGALLSFCSKISRREAESDETDFFAGTTAAENNGFDVYLPRDNGVIIAFDPPPCPTKDARIDDDDVVDERLPMPMGSDLRTPKILLPTTTLGCDANDMPERRTRRTIVDFIVLRCRCWSVLR
mmetsp:Transcript_17027/g.26721  ORF Transcript_17027/g.26721 Transcript_17027/m.26721 type:complete len:187 (-) Transcript_17027:54-614(-)